MYSRCHWFKIAKLLWGALFIFGGLVTGVEARTEESKEIKVGVIIPLTGDWAIWGEGIQRALELYAEEHVAPYRFRLQFEDEGTCDAKRAVDGYKRLKKDSIEIFVLGCMNGARAIVPLARRDNSLLFSAGFEEQEIFKAGARFINLALQIDSEAKALASAISALAPQKVAIVRNEGVDAFITGMTEVWKDSVTMDPDLILSAQDQDFGTILTKIKAAKSDLLFANLGEFQLSSLLKKVRELKLSIPVFTSYGTDSLARGSKELMSLAEGVRFTHPQRSSAGEALKKRFESKYSTSPNVNSYFVYDGLHLLQKALERCAGGVNTKCLFDFFADGSARSGVSGNFTINRDGSIVRKFELRSVQKGEIVTVISEL